MLVSEEARVFQVRGLRCSKEPTVLGLSPVRLGNRTYRAWRTTKLTPMGFAISTYTDGSSRIGVSRINWSVLGILPLNPTYDRTLS